MIRKHNTPKAALTKVCTICGATYSKNYSVSMKSWNASGFCSRKCVNVGRSPSNKGTRGVMKAWNKGIPNPDIRGSNNPMWKGTDMKYFRNLVLERDNYECQACGLYEPEIMQVDHIKPKSLFPELKFNPNNMITLCPNCHARKTVKELKEGISADAKKATRSVEKEN